MQKVQELEEVLINKSISLLSIMDEDENAAKIAQRIIPWTIKLITFTHSAACYWPTHEDSQR